GKTYKNKHATAQRKKDSTTENTTNTKRLALEPRAPIVTTDNQPSSHFNTQDNSAKRHISFQKRSLDERSSSSSDTEHIEPYAEVRVDHGSSMEDSDSSSLSSGNDVSITPYNPARVDPRSLEEDVESESSTSTVSSMSSIHTPSIVPHDPQVRDRSQPEPQTRQPFISMI
uniref:Uncharacterized protein n=1 Tax=Ciona intestinalis TaxID=7719 RepID=F6Z955_CIOIN